MAGVAGFEPTHDWIKTSCLTAWLYPNCVANFEAYLTMGSLRTF